MVKDKARMYQVQRHELPEKVVVKLAELEEKVHLSLHSRSMVYVHEQTSSGKGTRYFDVSPFLKSKVFAANGYVVRERNIEKHFRMD
jgi:DNA replication licensing factor MCM2